MAAPRRPSATRTSVVVVALLVVLAAAAFLSIAVGARDISLTEVWRALVEFHGSPDDLVVIDQRGPRTLTAVVVGAALGMAGAVTQGLTRNALADPGLLGVSAGSAFAVCAGIAAFGVAGAADQAWFALAGALIVSVLVFVLGNPRGVSSTASVTLVLTGTAVTAFLTALTGALNLLDTATLDAFRFWTVGALAGRDLAVVTGVAPFLAIGAIIAVTVIPGLDALSMGEDVARSLGNRVAAIRTAGLAAVALLTGGAVAAAGPMVFVGLVAPHLARGLVGADHRRLVPTAALSGAIVVLVADSIGRLVARPDEVAAGVVVGLIGTPVFVLLARRRRAMSL